MAPAKSWFLYVIACRDGSLYTGITVDLAARYAAHCQGTGARYTRAHPPVRLLGYQTHLDRASASRAEYQVKKLSTVEKHRFVSTLLPWPDTLGSMGDQ